MYHSRLSPLQSMRQRARVYAAAMPYALIDTDGQFEFCIKDHPAELLAEQLKLGIPTIYNGKLLRQNRFFLPARYGELTEDDYALISQIFKAQYRKL